MSEGSQYRTMHVDVLLGRTLNDIETKYAPKEIYTQGSLDIPLPCPKVSIIGTRKPLPQGLEDAQYIAKTLTNQQIIVVSGLAEGIDTAVHQTAIKSGGKTIAVLGTPLNEVYPKKNFELQQEIIRNHLAISQYPEKYLITKKNFVLRNRTMALISDASIIVEAGNSSGSLHQGWETLRLGRPLFIWKTLLNNSELDWPETMLEYGAMELSDPMEVLEVLPSNLKMIDLFQ